MLSQLNGFFGMVEKMQAVDTSGVLPLAHPVAAIQDVVLRLRDDVASEPNQREANKRSAPAAGRRPVPRAQGHRISARQIDFMSTTDLHHLGVAELAAATARPSKSPPSKRPSTSWPAPRRTSTWAPIVALNEDATLAQARRPMR